MKLKYLDGLRLIFCIIVVIHHFLLAFCPDTTIFLYNDGNLAVVYFLLLSGFVTPLKIFYDKDVKKKKKTTKWLLFLKKRYLRLLPFVAISIIISFLLLKNDLYYNLQAAEIFNLSALGNYFNFDISFAQMIYQIFIGTFIERPILNTPLWTIHYEFIGVFVAYILADVLHKKEKRHFYYLLTILICMILRDIYYCCIFTGVFLADVFFNKNKVAIGVDIDKIKHYNIIFLILSIILYFLTIFGKIQVYLRMLSIICGMIFVINNKVTQKLLENKLLMKLSEYATDIYATHWLILCSFSSWLLVYLKDYKFSASLIITFAASTIVITLAAIIFKMVNNILLKIIDNLYLRRNKHE